MLIKQMRVGKERTIDVPEDVIREFKKLDWYNEDGISFLGNVWWMSYMCHLADIDENGRVREYPHCQHIYSV